MVQPPGRAGLYDPRFEHDACGVAFVVDMHGRRSHEHRRAPASARCATSTTAAPPAPRPNTGDGAGILDPDPRRVPARRSSTSSSRRPGAYAVGHRASCPPTPATPRRRQDGDRDDRRRRGPDGRSAGATCPIDRLVLGATAPRRRCRAFRQLFVADAGGATGHRPRPAGVRRPQADRARARRRRAARLLPVAVGRTLVYKGMLTTPQLARVLPRPRRRAGRVGARARAQPLLDQHVPVVAARPPVPLHRPQRRDQHGAGQPQLDARPRGAAADADLIPGPRAGVPDLHARRRPTPPASTRCSSCCTSAAARCRTPC